MRRWRAVTVVFAAAVVGLGACTPPTDGGGSTTTVPPDRPCGSIEEVPLIGGAGFNAQASRDGRSVVYVSGDQVRVFDPVLGTDRSISANLPTGRSYGSLQISTDSQRVAVLSIDPGTTRRRAWIVELATSVATELDWSGVDWPNFTFSQGFSGDLSVFVSMRFGTDQYRFVPSDGSGIIVRNLPLGSSAVLNEDGSILAGRSTVWRNGTLVTYPGPLGQFEGVRALRNNGSEAEVTVGNGTVIWNLDSGVVTPGPVIPGADPNAPSWGYWTDDDRYFVGGATIGGVEAGWRIDTLSGEVTQLPSIDGITSVSDNARIITSTYPQLVACTG